MYHNTKNAWLTSPIFSHWFIKHIVPEVRHCQENVLRIAKEEAKAFLLLDKAPTQQDAEKTVSVHGKNLCDVPAA